MAYVYRKTNSTITVRMLNEQNEAKKEKVMNWPSCVVEGTMVATIEPDEELVEDVGDDGNVVGTKLVVNNLPPGMHCKFVKTTVEKKGGEDGAADDAGGEGGEKEEVVKRLFEHDISSNHLQLFGVFDNLNDAWSAWFKARVAPYRSQKSITFQESPTTGIMRKSVSVGNLSTGPDIKKLSFAAAVIKDKEPMVLDGKIEEEVDSEGQGRESSSPVAPLNAENLARLGVAKKLQASRSMGNLNQHVKKQSFYRDVK